MKEILLTSSVLILALLALRRVFHRTISRRLQYALWALVLVRLLIPVNFGAADYSVLSAAGPVQTAVETRLESSALYLPTARAPLTQHPDASDLAPQRAVPRGESSAWVVKDDSTAIQYHRLSAADLLTWLWHAGMLGVGGWFVFTNLRFGRRLRRVRSPYPAQGCRYPVYLVPELPSPCLFGVLRPAIYLNTAAVRSPETLRFVLAHETTHARHRDPLWALLRGVCLTVYWFDPLVWLAALCAREDRELACDEGTLRSLSQEERIAYGRALLALVPVGGRPRNPLLGATTMTSGKRNLKERITRIAENRKTRITAACAALALALLMCVLTFSGNAKPLGAVCGDFWDTAAQCTVSDDKNDGANGLNLDALRLSEHLAGVRVSGPRIQKATAVDADWLTLQLTVPSAEEDTYERLTLEIICERDTPDGTKHTYSLNIGTQCYPVVSGAEELDAFLGWLRAGGGTGELAKTQRAAIDDLLRWAQGLRAEDIANLHFLDGSGSRILMDTELSALTQRLVPLLNSLTEADLYTRLGNGDSTYYTLCVNMQDGTQYRFSCGFDQVRFQSLAFEPGLSSSYPSRIPTLWIDSPALVEFINALGTPPMELPDCATVAPKPLADILPDRAPWLTIPIDDTAGPMDDRRIPSGESDWLTQVDLDGDGVCEIVNTSNTPAIYYKRNGQLYVIDLRSVITAAWPELNDWDRVSVDPDGRYLLLSGFVQVSDRNILTADFHRHIYFDGENLLLYKRDRSAVDHVAVSTRAQDLPDEVVAQARAIVERGFDAIQANSGNMPVDPAYDDWIVSVSPVSEGRERYPDLALEIYLFSYEFHAAAPSGVTLAGGMYCDEDGWTGGMYCGEEGPYLVYSAADGQRRLLEGSMAGDVSTGAPAYYADLAHLLVRNSVIRPDELATDDLFVVMWYSQDFLNWLGQYDAEEQVRALTRLHEYRAALSDPYDLERYNRDVSSILNGPDGLTDVGRQAAERFRTVFE